MHNRMMIPALSFTTSVLGTAKLAVAACGGQAPAPAVPDADAPASTAPSGGASDLSALATCDVVLVDRSQMADQPCHGMAGMVMGRCTLSEAQATVRGSREPMTNSRTRAVTRLAVALCALLATGCGNTSDGPVASATRPPSADAGAPSSVAGATARPGTGPDDIVYDRSQMAEFPCHGMAFTIMGKCTPDEQAQIEVKIRERAAAGLEIGVIELDHVADGDPTSPGSVDPVRAEDIVYDPNAMAEFPCHAMGNTIMGDCTPAEIDALRAQLLARRASGAPAPEPIALFAPGDDLEGRTGPAPKAGPSMTLDLEDGARFDMDARSVTWAIDDATFPGYAYNGVIPGPLIHVRQGSTINVDFTNRIDMDTTIHWHGLRHESGMDGVPGVSQTVVKPGGTFAYRLRFPDEGIYWYHPHVREDIQQDAGMYGMMLVEPAEVGDWPAADIKEVMVLDDLFIEDAQRVPYGRDHASFAIMGRFGNVMVVNGQSDYRLEVEQGDVVRFYVGNVANVRTFRFSFNGAPMKRVGGDMGRYAREAWVDDVIIAPAERYIVDVAFDEVRDYLIVHNSGGKGQVLGTVHVQPSNRAQTAARGAFDTLRVTSSVVADIEPFQKYAELPPDIELELTVDIPEMITSERADGPALSTHSRDNAADEDHEVEADEDAAHAAEGIEWEDDMLAVNRASTAADVDWMIRDKASGAVNHEVAYAFSVGDKVRIRLHNLGDSQHPMQHPIHFHGQRLLVLSRNGVRETNPVWKDTILMPVGETAEIVMDVTNPGTWMVHCHIAEHLETGMMFQFTVTD